MQKIAGKEAQYICC